MATHYGMSDKELDEFLPMPKRSTPPVTQVVGCYIMHLYCGECYAHGEFTGETKQEAIRSAKNMKWSVRFGRDYARCPKHTLAAKLK